MKLEKRGNQIIDVEISNEETQQKNRMFLLEHGFQTYNGLVPLSIEEKMTAIDGCGLMFHVDIEAIMKYTNIAQLNVITDQPGRCPCFIELVDKNGSFLRCTVTIKCPKCGRTYQTQRGHLMRRTHLLCKKCSCSFAQLNGGMAKFEETMMKRYGCRRPIQNKEIHDKIKETMQQRYGADSPLESQVVQKKIAETMIERYGVDNPFCSKEFQYKAKKNYINHSAKGDGLMEKLAKDLPFTLLYGDNEKLFTFKNHWYRVDGYVEEKKVAIEFQGDYYHANPSIYEENHVFNNWGKEYTAKDVWEKDAFRKQELENAYHIKIVYVWEKELDDFGYEFVLEKVKKELGI